MSKDMPAEVAKLEKQIKSALLKANPNGYNQVFAREFFDEWSIRIWFAPIKDNEYFMPISLSLRIDKMLLESQMYGGRGGLCIYRKPRIDCKNERYLAMQRIKLPFRKPKSELKFVLKAIDKLVANLYSALKENENELFEKDLVVLRENNVL